MHFARKKAAWTLGAIVLSSTLLFVGSAAADDAADIACKDYRFLDESERFSICKQEAEDGRAQAQLMLGYMYSFGISVEEDKETAHYWFERAAEQGNAEAAYNAAEDLFDKMEEEIFLNGTAPAEADIARMVELWTLAADKGYEPAQFELGMWYEQGPNPDPIKAYTYYELSSRNGGPVADEAKQALAAELDPAQIEQAVRAAEELIAQQ